MNKSQIFPNAPIGTLKTSVIDEKPITITLGPLND
jgi:hypothetical protein